MSASILLIPVSQSICCRFAKSQPDLPSLTQLRRQLRDRNGQDHNHREDSDLHRDWHHRQGSLPRVLPSLWLARSHHRRRHSWAVVRQSRSVHRSTCGLGEVTY